MAEALAASAPEPSTLRVLALRAAGELTWRKGDRASARARLAEVRNHLDERAIDAALAEGRATARERLVEEAL